MYALRQLVTIHRFGAPAEKMVTSWGRACAKHILTSELSREK